MKKILFSSVLLFQFSFISLAQIIKTSDSKCQYYSPVEIKTYKFKIDSIFQFYNKKYDTVLFIGNRNFSGAKALFIIKADGLFKGYLYDFIKHRYKTISNNKPKEMADQIRKNSKELKTSRAIQPQYISHDLSFFVSDNNGTDIYEVCYSQVMTIKSTPLGNLFVYYMKNFR